MDVLAFMKMDAGIHEVYELISPSEIGTGIVSSPFSVSFGEDAIERSRQFHDCYKKVADEKGCIFLDAAKFIYPSKTDSLHLTAEGHIALAE